MATASCTFGGLATYNNGWASKSFSTSTSQYGVPAFGIVNSTYRAIVIKFTTPTFASSATNKKITISVPLSRTSAGTDFFRWRIYSSSTDFSGTSTSNLNNGTYITDNTGNVSTTTSYASKSFTASSESFQSNTTYYMWIYSDTPNGTSTIGYVAHHSTYGLISVSMSYDEVTATHYRPTVSLSTDIYGYYSGFYGGAYLSVSSSSLYPFIYVGNSSSGTYYRKATSGKSVYIEADKSSTSKTIYVTRTDIDLGAEANLSLTSSQYRSYSVPRYACSVYCHSSSPTLFSGSSGTFSPSYNGSDYSNVVLTGLASSESSTVGNVGASWTNYGPTLNGKEWYGIYTNYDKDVTYYLGGSSSYKAEGTSTLYGITGETNVTVEEPSSTMCDSDNTYNFIGWTTSSSSTTVKYNTLAEVVSSVSGKPTVYGIFKKNASTSTELVYYYRGNSYKRSVNKTISSDESYYYGKGSFAGGEETCTYGTVNTDCAVSGWDFIGFTDDPNVQSSTSSAEDLFNAGATTIYGTYSKTESMTYYPQNGEESGAVSVINYRYGAEGNVTENIPEEPILSNPSYTQVGWAKSSTTSVYNTWDSLWNAGTRTVYAVWKLSGGMWYGVDDEWKLLTLYYGVNDTWVPLSIKYGVSDNWK